MNNILIINLRRLGDVLMTSHLIHSIKVKEPHSSISILVDEDSKKSAMLLSGVDNVFTLKTRKISNFLNNRIFSNGFGLNRLREDLHALNSEKWSKVINVSHDPLACYLSGYLNFAESVEVKGLYQSAQLNLMSSNKWTTYLNEHYSQSTNAPFHLVELQSKIAQVPLKLAINGLKSFDNHEDRVKKTFYSLKSSQKVDSVIPKIIGIQLVSSDERKNPNLSTMAEATGILFDDPRYIPITLISPTEQDRARLKEFHQIAGRKFINIESDLKALTAVIRNLDCVITPDTVTKHMADILQTPCLELSMGYAPYLKQGSVNPRSLILSAKISARSFSEKTITDDEIQLSKSISSGDIVDSLDCLFNEELINKVSLSPLIQLIRPSHDEHGLFYKTVAGGDIMSDFKRHYLKAFLHHHLEGQTARVENSTARIDRISLSKFFNSERDELTTISKNLLNTLRCLLYLKDSKINPQRFIQTLDQLLLNCEGDGLGSILVSMFRFEIENNTEEDQFGALETRLYDLKDRVKASNQYINRLEERILSDISHKKGKLIQDSISLG